MREMEILKGLEGGENMAVQFVDHLLALGLRKRRCWSPRSGAGTWIN